MIYRHNVREVYDLLISDTNKRAMMGVPYCSVQSTWNNADTRQLSDYIVYRVESDAAIGDPTSSSLPTEQIILIPPSDLKPSQDDPSSTPPPCMLTCQCSKTQYNMDITGVDVICSARYMEVYAQCGEYAGTCHGARIDDDIGSEHKLYLLQHTLDPPTSSCQVKLLGMMEKSELRLHSIHITLTENHSRPPDLQSLLSGPSSIDTDSLCARMDAMGTQLPDNAQLLLDSMKAQSKRREQASSGIMAALSSSTNTPPTMASLMSFMAMASSSQPQPPASVSTGLNKPASMKNTVSQSMSEPSVTVSVGGTERPAINDSHAEAPMPVETLQDMAKMFRQEVAAIETRMYNHINSRLDDMEQKIDARFDQVVTLLQGSCHVKKKEDIELD